MAKTASRPKPKKGTQIINVAFVWDMSGSMHYCHQATVAGTKDYLANLQKEEKKLVKKKGEGVFTRFSLTAFDTVFEQWAIDEPIAEVNVAKLIAPYQPRGNTALYDAIANTITDVETRMRGGREDEKVMVIIMTDGGENASQEYAVRAGGRERILALIKSYEERGNWTFIWLASGVDAMREAADLGIHRGNTVSFDSASPDSVAAVSASLASVTSTRRSSMAGQTVSAYADAGLGTDYRAPEKKQQKKKQ